MRFAKCERVSALENFSCRVKNLLPRSFVRGFFVAALASVPGFALAATSTPTYSNTASGGNLTVSMLVTSACEVTNSGPTLLISNWTLSQYTANSTSTGSVNLSVQCSNGIPYSIGLGSSNDAGTSRVLTSTSTSTPTATIPYTLFQPNSSTVWGNTPSSSYALSGTGVAQNTLITASVPAQTTMPAPGTYTDTVPITVSY